MTSSLSSQSSQLSDIFTENDDPEIIQHENFADTEMEQLPEFLNSWKTTSLGSVLHEHFTYVGHVKGSRTSVILRCNHCRKTRKGGGGGDRSTASSSNFIRHIKSIHKLNVNSKLNIAKPKNKKDKLPGHHPRQMKLRQHMLDVVAIDGLPFCVTNGIGFKNLFETFLPELSLPSEKTISRDLLAASETAITSLQTDLAKQPEASIHISLDIWTSRAREGILGVRVHFIDDKWKPISRTIAFVHMNEAHSGENIKKHLLKALRSVDISTIQVGKIMADSASNITKAVKIAHPSLMASTPAIENNSDESIDEPSGDETDDDCEGDQEVHYTFDWERIMCVAHTIQLSINNTIKGDDAVSELVQSVSKIVTFFRRSVKWSTELRKKVTTELILPGTTRWNSILYSMERLSEMEIFTAVKNILKEANFESRNLNILTTEKRARMLELQSLLSPLAQITDFLQAKDLTSSRVIPSVIFGLESVAGVACFYFADYQYRLLDDLTIRLQKYMASQTFLMSVFLHPNQKLRFYEDIDSLQEKVVGLHFPQRSDALQSIIAEVAGVMQTDNSNTAEVDSSANAETTRNVWSFFNKKPRTAFKDTPTSEVMAYLNFESTETDPLKFWKHNDKRFKNLAVLARRYLAIPATSGDVERLFSIAGALKRARRARLAPTKIEQMLIYREFRAPELQSE